MSGETSASLLLTLREAGDELRVSEDSVYRLIQKGRLSAVDVGTGGRSRTRVLRSELERFIAANTRTAGRRLRPAS